MLESWATNISVKIEMNRNLVNENWSVKYKKYQSNEKKNNSKKFDYFHSQFTRYFKIKMLNTLNSLMNSQIWKQTCFLWTVNWLIFQKCVLL